MEGQNHADNFPLRGKVVVSYRIIGERVEIFTFLFIFNIVLIAMIPLILAFL